jgi:hypothetical protein
MDRATGLKTPANVPSVLPDSTSLAPNSTKPPLLKLLFEPKPHTLAKLLKKRRLEINGAFSFIVVTTTGVPVGGSHNTDTGPSFVEPISGASIFSYLQAQNLILK